MIECTIGEKVYEFESFNMVFIAKEIYSLCNSQEEFENKLEESNVDFFYPLPE